VSERIRSLLVLAGGVCLLSAPAATAGRVGWTETAKVDRQTVMRYQVSSVTIGKANWSARVAFSNLSNGSIQVGATRFGIAFYSDSSAESLSEAIGFALATRFSAMPPKTLKPGASWSGVISGSGSLSADGEVYVRVVFGPFSGLPGESRSVVWITDHATTVGAGATSPGGGQTVI
jgi:hypothetical protein